MSLRRGGLSKYTKYGHVVNAVRTSRGRTKGLTFARIFSAHVVYDSVGARHTILRTLGGITRCGKARGRLALASGRKGTLLALRGHPRAILSTLGKG